MSLIVARETLIFSANSYISYKIAEKLIGTEQSFPVTVDGKTRYQKIQIENLKHAFKFLVGGKNNKNKTRYWKQIESDINSIEEILSNYAYKGTFKSSEGEDLVSLISLDIERKGGSTKLTDSVSDYSEYAQFRYLTASATETDQRNRLVFVLDRPVNYSEFKRILEVIYGSYSDDVLDKSCNDPGRLYFPGTGVEKLGDAFLPVDKILSIANAYNNGLYENFQNLTLVQKPLESSDGITSKINRYFIGKLYRETGDINNLFFLYPHDLREQKDNNSEIITKWVGNNPFTDNKSGESFCVSLKTDGNIVWNARGSEKSGSYLKYVLEMLKIDVEDRSAIFEKNATLQGRVFQDIVDYICVSNQIELPPFYEKNNHKTREKDNKKGSKLTKIVDEFNEVSRGCIRWNDLEGVVELTHPDGGHADQDEIFNKFYLAELFDYDLNYRDNDLVSLIRRVAKKNRYHPVKQYLERCYDKYKDNLDINLFSNISTEFFRTENNLYNLYIRKLMIAAVKRVYEPGCKFDNCTVLQGTQGNGKTTFWQVLSTLDFYSGSVKFTESDRDELMKLQTSWFIDLSEINTIFTKKRVEDMRKFLDERIDKYREPYGKQTIKHPRSCVIVSTVNEDNFLCDTEGTRRYWVIPVSKDLQFLDLDRLEKVRDQLWATAYHFYKQGEQIFLTKEQDDLRAKFNENYQDVDSWHEPIILKLSNFRSISIHQIWTNILKESSSSLQRRDEIRIANILKNNKWTKKRISYKEKNHTIWLNPDEPKGGVTFHDLYDREVAVTQFSKDF